jgi:geranylgeranyl diphosphate synthase type I
MKKSYSEFRKWFDAKLEKDLDGRLAGMMRSSDRTGAASVFHYARKISRGGKRIRPYVAYLGHEEYDGHTDALPLLLALEYLHIACIIHDDVMDRSEKRHGIDTPHRHFERTYKNENLANSLAVILGDVFLTMSWSLLDFPDARKKEGEIRKQFEKMIYEVIFGQTLDLLMAGKKSISGKDLLRKTMLKSARYTFWHPMAMGAYLAGADIRDDRMIRGFAEHVGLAFQIQDDLLDIDLSGISEKSSFVDISGKQATFATFYMLHRGNDMAKKRFLEFFGKKSLDAREKRRLDGIMEAAGAGAFIKKEAEGHIETAGKFLKKSSLKNPEWENLIRMIEQRKK